MSCFTMNRKSILFFIQILFGTFLVSGQATGYYNGTEGLNGEELQKSLHQIIDGHQTFSYYSSKFILAYSDADPNNPDNIIQVYTGRSHPNDDYGSSGDYLNREHVWAKSHGGFNEWEPMYNDVHNLKPSDASVNQSKGNKDFDEGGSRHPEATGCYYTSSTWEPRDEVKGDIARIIFYMSVRYEGDNDEIDLEVVNQINTYPDPEHGKLNTLLEWNLLDPPDEFEMNRNNVIAAYQKNRNPFIDDPDFAELIWNNAMASPVRIGDVSIYPVYPVGGEDIKITAGINSTQGSISYPTLWWGLTYENLDNAIDMVDNGGRYDALIPGQPGGTKIYYQISAGDGTNTASSVIYTFDVYSEFTGSLKTIYQVQGQQSASPFAGQYVSTTGVVTANLGYKYYIQDGQGQWNGISIDDPVRNPTEGDSVIVTGKVMEVYGLTEITDISAFYPISSGNKIPDPVKVATGDAPVESYESVLIKVENALCTNANYWANDYMWKVDDGTGSLWVQNTFKFEYNPNLGESYNVRGPLGYNNGDWKIDLSSSNDVSIATAIIEPSSISYFNVYPVPAGDVINIEMNALYPVVSHIQLVDISGRLVLEQQYNCFTGPNHFSLNVRALSPGSYILTGRSGHGMVLRKVFIH